MVASIGAISSPSQGASYYERDGYYAKDDAAHREASAWAGKGAEALGLSGPVDPDTFQAILEGRVPDGPHLGKRGKDGEIHHRPGRDVTMSAPKSVSLMSMIGGDERIVAAHDRAVGTTLGWIEKNAILTRLQDPGLNPGQAPGTGPGQVGSTGSMVFAGDQKTVIATFRHDTSRNLDPQLHTHCVIANMVQGGDGKWRTMVNDGLYRQQRAISAIYRAELAEGIARLGYEIERTHADGRFEIAGISRETIEAFSTRRAEIEAAMKARGYDDPADDKRVTNGQLATVDSIEKDGVRFRLEDGSLARLAGNDPQLRHLDRAWAATVHAFQGRTVDRIIAAMPAGNPNLVNQKSFYVAIGRARERADLITDDPKRLADHLQRATGERVAALDAVAEHAAREAEAARLREPEHLVRAFEALDRSPGAAREGQRAFDFERAGYGTGRGREDKSPDLAGKRDKALSDPGQRDRERGGEGREVERAARPSEREMTPEPPQKSRELDLGL